MPDRSPSEPCCAVPLPFDYPRTPHCERLRAYRCSRAVAITTTTPTALTRSLVALVYAYTQQREIPIDLFTRAGDGAIALSHLRFTVHIRHGVALLSAREAAGRSSVGLSISSSDSDVDLDALLPASHDLHFLVRVGARRAFFHVAYDSQLFADATAAELAERFTQLSRCGFERPMMLSRSAAARRPARAGC